MAPILGIFASSQQGAAAATSFESIATVSVGSGGVSNVEFTSIPGTYSHLQIRIIGRSNASSANDFMTMQFNNDTAANYRTHQLSGDGASVSAGDFGAINQMYVQRITSNTALSNTFGAIIIDILDYANTNKFKTSRLLGGFDINGSGGLLYFHSGLWRSTSAVTSIKIAPGSGSLVQYSHFALYGIKGVA